MQHAAGALVEQLAGDEMKDSTRDSIIATGYYRLGSWQDEPVDWLQAKYDDLDDIVATFNLDPYFSASVPQLNLIDGNVVIKGA